MSRVIKATRQTQQIDMEAVARHDVTEVSFTIERRGSGDSVCRENVFKEERAVRTFADVERFIEDLAEGLNFEDDGDMLAERTGDGRGFEYASALRAAYVARAVENARVAWSVPVGEIETKTTDQTASPKLKESQQDCAEKIEPYTRTILFR